MMSKTLPLTPAQAGIQRFGYALDILPQMYARARLCVIPGPRFRWDERKERSPYLCNHAAFFGANRV
jgi:hypothetical protein